MLDFFGRFKHFEKNNLRKIIVVLCDLLACIFKRKGTCSILVCEVRENNKYLENKYLENNKSSKIIYFSPKKSVKTLLFAWIQGIFFTSRFGNSAMYPAEIEEAAVRGFSAK